jgi:hypothetical protein
VNIPADVSELAEGAGSTGGMLPAGALQTRTDFGVPGYGGPCPPEGDHPHRYLFTVFAVKTDKLDVKIHQRRSSASICISIRWRGQRSWDCLKGKLIDTPPLQFSLGRRQWPSRRLR